MGELDKFEFKTVKIPRGSRNGMLNFYGSRGWEVISVQDLWQGHVTVNMKRRKPEKPPRIKKEKPVPVRDEKPQPLANEGPSVVRHRMPEYSGGLWAWITGRH